MVVFYGNPIFLNIISPKILLDWTEINNTKCFVILDKINSNKENLEKFTPID